MKRKYIKIIYKGRGDGGLATRAKAAKHWQF
jgi:hypothetical protein